MLNMVGGPTEMIMFDQTGRSNKMRQIVHLETYQMDYVEQID